MPINYWFLVWIVFFSFLIQTLPRFWISDFGIDTWRWLLYAKEIRENRFRIPKYIEKYLVLAPYSYPPLFHYFLAMFPPILLKKLNFVIAPFFSVLEMVLVFFMVSKLTEDTMAPVIGALVYASTSANIVENNNLNTRSFGQIFYSIMCFFLATHLYIQSNFWWLSLSICLLLLAHRMSSQLALLTLFTSAIYGRSVEVILALFIGVALAYLASFGHYGTILLGHWRQVSFWRRKILENRARIKLSWRDFFKSIISRNLWVGILPILLVGRSTPLLPYEKFLVLLIIQALIVAIATTFYKPLRCVGEGYRYMGYITPAVAILVGRSFKGFEVAVFFFAFVSAMPAIYKQIQLLRNRANPGHVFHVTAQIRALLDGLFEARASVNFGSYPPVFDDYVAYQYSSCKVLFHDNGFACDRVLPPMMGEVPDVEIIIRTLQKYKIEVFISQYDIEIPTHSKRKFGDYFVYEA